MKKMVKGELTAFLSLVFLLLISFVGAILESASIQVMKNERRADAGRALESVFAEYQKDLFEEYKIFALDGSYETESFSDSNILNRLSYYGAENIETEIKAVRYLTDQNGKAFYEQAVQYEKEKTGMDKIEEMFGDAAVLEDYNNKWGVYEKEEKETSTKLNQLLQESEQQLPMENNPLQVISDLKAAGLLEIILPENFELSQKAIVLSERVSARKLREGYGEWDVKKDQVQDTIFFNLYVKEHMGSAGNVKEKSALAYELEYLLIGKGSDKENLEGALTQMCNLRFAANYVYLLSDSAKQAEARALAGTLCTLLTVPGVTEIVTQAMLLAWAYGEAVMDVRTLIGGEKVSLWKSNSNWKLSLENLLKLNEVAEIQTSGSDENGLSYDAYLQMLLFLKDKEELTLRTLDLIELNLREVYGKTFFDADSCVVGMKMQGVCNLRRGIQYKFMTEYQYQ